MSRGDRGQTALLIVGCATVILLLAVVVVNSSAAFLQRQRLADLADGAALAAADHVSEARLYSAGIASFGDAPLDRSKAIAAVGSYLAATGQADRLEWSVSTDTDMVTVRLVRTIALPFVPPGWFEATTITADATSLLRIHD